MSNSEKALQMHEQWNGKLETTAKAHVNSREDLAIAYTPGVAEPCKVIAKDPEAAYKYTIKSNTVAVVSDGSAVLGLGNIGALAAMPVMEGKAVLRSGQPRTSATVYNREMCLLALQTIAFYSISFLNSSPLFALKYAGAISNTVLHPL